MAIYRPSELRQFLQELGIAPKKGLSQNFLIDGNIIRKIVSAGNVSSDDVILEIGPGPGSLTEALLDTGAQVIAVEKDKQLAESLERLQTDKHRLAVFCDDILTFPLKEIIGNATAGAKKAKVLANLPYHLTTPIVVELLPLSNLFSTIVVMVQEEVARRWTASPGTSEYGSISVFIKFFADIDYAFSVSKNCFFPVPKVDSAVVVFKLKQPRAVSNQTKFFEMTRCAFKHRRKMLRASLREFYPSEAIEKHLEAMGCSSKARPEELSLEQFLDLFERLQN